MILPVVALFFLAHTVTAQDAGLAGTYDVAATNPDGSPYRGSLTITQDGDSYGFFWNVISTFQGAGFRDGNIVVVGWGGDQCSAVLYRVQPDGALQGRWSVAGTRGFGSELAQPAARTGSVAGAYAVNGTNPDGSPYTGSLQITERGPTYQMGWDIPRHYDGVGVRLPDTVSGSWGPGACAVVAYEVQADGSLVGVWGLWGEDGQGTETARKR